MTLNRTTPRKHVEWRLLLNTFVEIRLNGQVLRTGFVEDAMPDSSALWIAANKDGPRQMFEASQGHQVWVTPPAAERGLQLPDDHRTVVPSRHPQPSLTSLWPDQDVRLRARANSAEDWRTRSAG